MSEVTVSQLASDVGILVDRLLKQLSDAGISKQSAEDIITEQEKMDLLNHLRRSHGKQETAGGSGARKIALKRKTTTELHQPASGRHGTHGSGTNHQDRERRGAAQRAVVKPQEADEETAGAVAPGRRSEAGIGRAGGTAGAVSRRNLRHADVRKRPAAMPKRKSGANPRILPGRRRGAAPTGRTAGEPGTLPVAPEQEAASQPTSRRKSQGVIRGAGDDDAAERGRHGAASCTWQR